MFDRPPGVDRIANPLDLPCTRREQGASDRELFPHRPCKKLVAATTKRQMGASPVANSTAKEIIMKSAKFVLAAIAALIVGLGSAHADSWSDAQSKLPSNFRMLPY